MNNCFMQKHVNIRQNAEQQEKAIAKTKNKKKNHPKLYSVIYMNMKVKHSKTFYHD